MAFSPDGRLVAASAAGTEQASAGEPGGPWEIRLIDADTARQVGRLPTDSKVIGALAFSPDGRLLAADNGDGRLRSRTLPSDAAKATRWRLIPSPSR